ncbi:MAG: hypothetical protein ACPGOV_11420 [Magnetovibrionaceae bacterium]
MTTSGTDGRTATDRAATVQLADHFLECSKLGRHLTLTDESRFVITDDFRENKLADPVATAVASIYSKDALVAQAALVPLGRLGSNRAERARYERLFDLIEREALSDVVRDQAGKVLERGFREAEIRAIEAELGDRITPARLRYRSFLGQVRQLMDKQIAPESFRDEFLEFTYAVAGKLDFGIYSFCLDRIFGNPVIPVRAKVLLVQEIMKYPPLIRRELLTNLLTTPGHDLDLVSFVREAVELELPQEAATEIFLLENLKRSRLAFEDIESDIVRSAEKLLQQTGLKGRLKPRGSSSAMSRI